VNTRSELEEWGVTWRAPQAAASEPAFDFRAEHRRQQWWLRVRHVFGIGFAVLLMGYAAVVLYRDFRAEVLAWAIVVWVTTAGITGFSVWNWRGLWSFSGRSVLEYAAIYEKRSLATLRAIRFGYYFLLLQLTISVPWLTLDFVHHEIPMARYVVAMGLLSLLTIGFLAWFTVSRRRAWMEIQRVEEFRLSLSGAR
jgi:hypothetical protein